VNIPTKSRLIVDQREQAWCHANPTRAMVEGFMVSRHVALPGDITVQSWYGPLLLRCDGDIEFDLTGADR
jgi:hypothetical protein